MLKSYEAVYEDGTLRWVREQPEAKRMRVIVTVLEEEADNRASATRKALVEVRKDACSPENPLKKLIPMFGRCVPNGKGNGINDRGLCFRFKHPHLSYQRPA